MQWYKTTETKGCAASIIYIYFLVHLIQEFAFPFLVYFNHSIRITKIKNKILYLSHDFEKKKLGQMARTNKVVKFEPEMSQLCLLLVSSNQGSGSVAL